MPGPERDLLVHCDSLASPMVPFMENITAPMPAKRAMAALDRTRSRRRCRHAGISAAESPFLSDCVTHSRTKDIGIGSGGAPHAAAVQTTG